MPVYFCVVYASEKRERFYVIYDIKSQYSHGYNLYPAVHSSFEYLILLSIQYTMYITNTMYVMQFNSSFNV